MYISLYNIIEFSRGVKTAPLFDYATEVIL
jgi:hypothetical protein